MNKKLAFTYLGIAAAALVIGLLAGRLLFAGGSPDGAGEETAPAAEAASEPTVWTCSMHPQIQQPDPGDCPICAMDLIPLEDTSADEGPREMSMSESSRALANIQTTLIERAFPEAQVRLVGKLAYDETREKALTARFPARIDELFVNFTGIQVRKGEHLAKVYSPELLSAQRELLTAHRSDPDGSITAAAREKLRLWDLLPEQIEEIIACGEAKDHFVLRAPIGGVVVAKNVNEGAYLKTGETLFRIVDLSVLWLYLDAYESDLPWLRYGQDVTFTVESFPGEEFHGRIAFIEPRVDPKTRTISVRVNVPNADSRLKPGMFARGIVKAQLAEGGLVYAPEFTGKWISPMHPEVVKDGPGPCDVCGMDLVPAESLGYVEETDQSAPLIIPSSAVLRTGKRAVVYLEKPDAERPTYEGREIVLGPRAGDYFVVASGLEEGERVVTSGAFKIDSALQIQAKPSMMAEDSEGRTSNAEGQETDTDGVKISLDVALGIVGPYLKMGTAMANDDFDGTREQLLAMMDVTGHHGPLPDLIHVMLAEEDMEGIRRPHFETLSNALIAAIKSDPSAFEEDLFLMHCPMVYGETGADWIQSTDELLNPYFGAMMLRCGEVHGKLN